MRQSETVKITQVTNNKEERKKGVYKNLLSGVNYSY
jgi:hypothetical protein